MRSCLLSLVSHSLFACAVVTAEPQRFERELQLVVLFVLFCSARSALSAALLPVISEVREFKLLQDVQDRASHRLELC